jgi:uncharacterized protein YvpB
MLKRGDRGPEVTALQTQLVFHGLDIKIDGHFGVATDAAVRVFQSLSKSNLTKDGQVGPYTQKALDSKTPLLNERINPIKILLNAPYYSQRDNKHVPSGTCNVTSLAMTMAYLGTKPKAGKQLEDELFERLLAADARAYFEKAFPWAKEQGYNPRNIHGMLLWLANQYGYKTKFTETATLTSLHDHLLNNGPVVTSGKFTSSGHIVTIIGFTHTWDFIIHDPWGDWEAGYAKDHDGNKVIYNLEDMAEILRGKTVDGKKAFMADLIFKP